MWLLDKIKSLFTSKKFKAKFTLEDRMNITDPDWRDDVARERSYLKIAMVLFVSIGVIALIIYASSALNTTPLQLAHKIFHEFVPHSADGGKDLLP